MSGSPEVTAADLGGISVAIDFGLGNEGRMYDSADGSGGQVCRGGFVIRWSRAVEAHVLFALQVRLRLGGVELEQGFTIREVGA